MGAIRLIFILFLLILNFIGAIFLLTKAGGIPFGLELIYIIVGIFVCLILLAGIGFEAKWAWPLGSIVFAVNLANAACLYFIAGAFLSFVLMVLFNAVGALTAIASISDEDDEDFESPESIDTYDAEPETKTKKRKR